MVFTTRLPVATFVAGMVLWSSVAGPVSTAATVQVVYDEAVSGDLDDSNFFGDPFCTGPGCDPSGFFSNDLGLLSVGTPGDPILNRVSGDISDGSADIFTVRVADGQQLDAIILSEYGRGDGALFLAIEDGDTFPTNFFFNEQAFRDFQPFYFGGSAVGPSEVGTDVLDNLGAGVVGQGFTGPLESGAYTIYVQQTGPATDYSFDFQTSIVAVPEPATAFALGVTAIVGWTAKRRRRSTRMRHAES